MFSEIKQRSRFLNQTLSRSNAYDLLRETTLAKYNKANVTKVLEHSLELDIDTDASILKAIDFYAENLALHPNQTKRNERIVLEYISKVRDIKQFRDSLKRRLSMHKNKANKVLKNIEQHKENLKTDIKDTEENTAQTAVQEFYSKALSEANLICTSDRIIKNYNEIARRFNIDYFICKTVTNINKSHKAAVAMCEFVETYNLSPKQKLQISLESTLWGLTKNGCPFNSKNIARSIIEFFNFNETISKEEAKDCLQKFNIYNPPVFNESVITSIVEKALPEFRHSENDLFVATPWDIFKMLHFEYANSKDFSPKSYIEFLSNIYNKCGDKVLGKSFNTLMRIIDYIVSINPKYNKMDYYNALITWVVSLNDHFFVLGLLDDIYSFNSLDKQTERVLIEEMIKHYKEELYKKQKEESLESLQEGTLLGKVDAIVDKFKSSLSSLSDKEKTASATFDAAIDSIKKSITDAGEQESREDVIADRYIPRASRVVKLAITLGIGYMVAPTLAVIGLFAYIAKTVATRTDERRKVLNEIDVEIDMCKRYIKRADEKDDLEKVRQYKLILKKLQDTREQVTSLMASKGENIYTDNKNDDD